jgi:hypothetical protein
MLTAIFADTYPERTQALVLREPGAGQAVQATGSRLTPRWKFERR